MFGDLIGERTGHLRLRDTYVRDVPGYFIHHKALGAAKLDLVLRCLSNPEGALPPLERPRLHDLCRDRPLTDDLKRKWVDEQLRRLRHIRSISPATVGRNSRIVLLNDRLDGGALSEPAGTDGDTFVRISRQVVTAGWLRTWDAPALAAYLCAMTAEGYAVSRLAAGSGSRYVPPGTGTWQQNLSWFTESGSAGHRPASLVRYPFSEKTIGAGLSVLKKQDLIDWNNVKARGGRLKPDGTTQAFLRRVYTNHFENLSKGPPVT